MKTVLQRLKSASSTGGNGAAAEYARLGLAADPAALRAAVQASLTNEMTKERAHDPARFSEADRAHLDATLRYLAARYMRGLAFVRSTGMRCSGDVGIVLGVSYAASPTACKDPQDSAAELFFPLHGDPETAVYFHVQVALPNGMATTWRINAIQLLDDDEGFLAFKSFYF